MSLQKCNQILSIIKTDLVLRPLFIDEYDTSTLPEMNNETTMDTDVFVEIDNINYGHVFSQVYAFHIGEICIILEFSLHLLLTLWYLETCISTVLSQLYYF